MHDTYSLANKKYTYVLYRDYMQNKITFHFICTSFTFAKPNCKGNELQSLAKLLCLSVAVMCIKSSLEECQEWSVYR